MKHRKTQRRRRHQSKRKSFRRTHRRRTYKRGGRAIMPNIRNSPCRNYLDRFITLKDNIHNQTQNTIEEYYGDVRSFYDEVRAASRVNPECHYLLAQIQAFENGELQQKMDQLLGM